MPYIIFLFCFQPLSVWTRVSSLFLLLDSQRPHIVSPFIFCLAVHIDKGEYSSFYIPPSRSSISLQTFFSDIFYPAPLSMCGRALFRLLYWMDVLSRANVIRRPTVIKTIPPLFGCVLCVCVHGANKRKKK